MNLFIVISFEILSSIFPGLYKVPYNLILFPKISVLLPFIRVIFFPTEMIFPSPLHTFIFFPSRLYKLSGPPPGPGGIRNFIHPLIFPK